MHTHMRTLVHLYPHIDTKKYCLFSLPLLLAGGILGAFDELEACLHDEDSDTAEWFEDT